MYRRLDARLSPVGWLTLAGAGMGGGFAVLVALALWGRSGPSTPVLFVAALCLGGTVGAVLFRRFLDPVRVGAVVDDGPSFVVTARTMAAVVVVALGLLGLALTAIVNHPESATALHFAGVMAGLFTVAAGVDALQWAGMAGRQAAGDPAAPAARPGWSPFLTAGLLVGLAAVFVGTASSVPFDPVVGGLVLGSLAVLLFAVGVRDRAGSGEETAG